MIAQPGASAPVAPRPSLADYLCEAIDVWRRAYPDLTLGEVRDALEELEGLFDRVAPSALVYSFGEERAARTHDSRDWSVKDALERAIDDAETLQGDDRLVKIYICLMNASGTHRFWCAGGQKTEYLGMLARQTHLVNEG